ncbi:glycosyltransferase [Myxococcota bacterium]|nr:glycosyltransferase [Myxococcota bacterium]
MIRGVEIAIDAIAKLLKKHPRRFALLIIGEGPMRAELAERVRALHLEDDVRLLGWMDYSKLPDVVTHSNIGILPFHDCDRIRASLANKLFEHMALGPPVIASDIPDKTRIVKDTGCGLVFPPNDVDAFPEAIESVVNDVALARRCAEAGRQSTQTLYKWDVDGARFVALIGAIHRQGRESAPLPASLSGAAVLVADRRRQPT